MYTFPANACSLQTPHKMQFHSTMSLTAENKCEDTKIFYLCVFISPRRIFLAMEIRKGREKTAGDENDTSRL